MFDVICAIDKGDGEVGIRIVQVKATPNNLAANCNEALAKFRRLENGDFDPELLDRLTLMQVRGELPDHCVPGEFLWNADGRRYRVTAMHEEDRDPITMMTTYDEKIIGNRLRRSARLIRVTNWEAFWKALGHEVYAQLT